MPNKVYIDYNILYNCYVIQNLTTKETADVLKCSFSTICRLVKKYHIKKNTSDIVNKRRQTCMIKYGFDNPSKVNTIKIKKENTCLKNFGVKYSFQSKKCNEKTKVTILNKYGVEYIAQNKDIQKKIKNTCLKRYGVDVPAKSPIIRDKMQNTTLKRYGVRSAMQLNSIKQKVFQSKLKNRTITFSKAEQQIYTLLCKKFKNVKQQYKSDVYPFNCDFYIPDLDLYIEYQGMWSHGKRSDTDIIGPYDENNVKHKEILKQWEIKSKSCPAYKTAIEVWTIRDPLKRKIAKNNHLNWLEFWTVADIKKWLANNYSIQTK